MCEDTLILAFSYVAIEMCSSLYFLKKNYYALSKNFDIDKMNVHRFTEIIFFIDRISSKNEDVKNKVLSSDHCDFF